MNHTPAQSCLGIASAIDFWILVLEAVMYFLRKLCNSRYFAGVWSLLQKVMEEPLSKMNTVYGYKAAGITCVLCCSREPK